MATQAADRNGSARNRSLLFAAALCGALALGLLVKVGSAGADGTVAAADRVAITEVIARQIDAFKRDDGVTAFSFASPSIRAKFGTADTFMRMVRSGYPQVYRPSTTTFVGTDAEGGRIVQRVLLTGPDGASVLALYFMERQEDGSWRIDGVQLVEPEGGTV